MFKQFLLVLFLSVSLCEAQKIFVPPRGGGGGSPTGGITLLQATGVVNGILISSQVVTTVTATNIATTVSDTEIARSNLTAFGGSLPFSRAVFFSSMTNQKPVLGFRGQDGQGYATPQGIGGGTNQVGITNGAWTVKFNESSNLGSHIWTTNLFPLDYQYMVMNYTQFNSAGVGNPSSFFLVSTQSFSSGGGFENIFHITLQNDAINVQLWTNGVQGTLATFNLTRGPDVGGVDFLFGYFFGDGTMTFFGNYISNGFYTVTNTAINDYKPVKGNPSYVGWEQYQGASATNVIYNINFTEIGYGNFAALDSLMPSWKKNYIYPTMTEAVFQGYTTVYGHHPADRHTNFGNAVTGPLSIWGTNASSLTVVMPNGNVGIGTATPAAVLDANGDTRMGPVGAAQLRTTTSGGIINLQGYYGGALRGSISLANGSGTDISITPGTAGVSAFTTGNVGVGTNSPAALLHLQKQGSNGVFSISGITNATPANGVTVSAWIPITLNGTNGFIPFYQ
jgi:hypothetical protein